LASTEPTPPSRSTVLPIDDQWLLVGVMAAGAALLHTTTWDLLRLPLTLAAFIAATPDTWIPLVVVVALMSSAIGFEWIGRSQPTDRGLWLLAGVVSMVGAWWYFRGGDLNWFTTQDWVKEWTYHTALRESLSHGRLPWILNDSFQGTALFFANAETNIAPHALLLGWVDVPTFVAIQAVVFVLIGVAAASRLAADLKFRSVASATFVSIFLMNGHVIAHLETGHLQWVAYFLLPCVLLFMHRAAAGDLGGRTQSGLSIALAMMALVGGWHVFVWCIIFIGAFVLIDSTRWRFGLSVALLTAGLTALRLLPGAVLFEMADREFVGSYQSLFTLTGAFVGEPQRAIDGLNWWEYNLFLGWVGFIVFLAGLTAPLGRAWHHPVSKLWLPSLVMLVLSCFNTYQWTLFNLPGFVSQRVATRLLVVGMLGFTLVACVQMNLWLERRPRSWWRTAALAAAALLMATQLVAHLNSRRPRPDDGKGAPAINVVSTRQPGPAYIWTVASGAIVSVISLGIAGAMWRRGHDS